MTDMLDVETLSVRTCQLVDPDRSHEPVWELCAYALSAPADDPERFCEHISLPVQLGIDPRGDDIDLQVALAVLRYLAHAPADAAAPDGQLIERALHRAWGDQLPERVAAWAAEHAEMA